MKQKELFPEKFIETVTCPRCGFVGDIDYFDCAGLPDFILACNQPFKPTKSKRINKLNEGRRCWCFIDTRTMTEWDGSGDSEFEERE